MKFETIEELTNLHRIVMNAKFSEVPLDHYVDVSPITASVANKVVDEIVSLLVSTGKSEVAKEWQRWRKFSGRTREGGAIECKVKRHRKDLRKRTSAEQVQFVDDVAAPFELSEEERGRFLRII